MDKEVTENHIQIQQEHPNEDRTKQTQDKQVMSRSSTKDNEHMKPTKVKGKKSKQKTITDKKPTVEIHDYVDTMRKHKVITWSFVILLTIIVALGIAHYLCPSLNHSNGGECNAKFETVFVIPLLLSEMVALITDLMAKILAGKKDNLKDGGLVIVLYSIVIIAFWKIGVSKYEDLYVTVLFPLLTSLLASLTFILDNILNKQ